jgi:hypothetical protein
LDEKLSYLPTKEEFYGKMDQVMGEFKAIRQEVAVLGYQVSDHGDRLGKTRIRPGHIFKLIHFSLRDYSPISSTSVQKALD